MKRFGTLFPFVESGEESLRLGRYVANYEFLVALLNYSSFDSFHLYCLTPVHFQNTLHRLSTDTDISNDAKEKVELFLFDSLEQNLKDFSYHCFHLGGWGYFWAGTVALRNRFARELFPITGIIHSLNSTETVTDAFKLAHSPHTEADGVICTTNSGREVLKKAIEKATGRADCFKGNLSVIPLGYNARFDAAIPKSEARRQLGIADADTVLLYLGRLSPTTKADLYPLLQVFRTLVDRFGSSLKLILAGGVQGAELRLHKDMITDLALDHQVRLMINFETSLKPYIYAASDIYVAPSDNIQETFGISIIEAMASSLPVVASDFDGYRELVENEITGLKIPTLWIDQHPLAPLYELLDPGTLQLVLAQSVVVDNVALESALDSLISDPQKRQGFGSVGAKRARESYRWERIIHQYEQLWDSLKDRIVTLPRPVVADNPFSPAFETVFSHYPTAQIDNSMIAELRPVGYRVLSGERFPGIYSDMPLVLDQEIINTILRELKGGVKRVSEFSCLGYHKFRTTLLWMAKYDLIRVVSA